MTKIYSTLDDYIEEVVAPAIASCGLDDSPTSEQLLAIAHAMTIWHDEYTPAGDIDLNHTGYIEDDTRDFWAVAWGILGE